MARNREPETPAAGPLRIPNSESGTGDPFLIKLRREPRPTFPDLPRVDHLFGKAPGGHTLKQHHSGSALRRWAGGIRTAQ